ncbi:MAG TPA: hydroxyethylthiazole kinase [Desulfomonilaceae bacterium]|nr:hydroxyethylthiazole kinase [Desulfomonilaceae bacterium]
MAQFGLIAGELLSRIRSARPVVHSVTNYVVMNSTANVLLAMGASPIMAHALEEMADITAIANSVVINIGTLSKTWIESMMLAGRLAKVAGKPLVLDPVGAGATKLRTKTAKEIIEESLPTVIRGNASEILSLSPQGGTTRGVDSLHTAEDAFDAARGIASALGTVVAVTGERDIVTDGEKSLVVSNGHALLGYVTGTGCAASVIVAAFLSQDSDLVSASAAALAFFGLAGEKAAAEAPHPGSFWVKVLDALYSITPEELEQGARITAL